MAFCRGCGAELAPDMKFCESCGTNVGAATPQQPPPVTPQQPPPVTQQQPPPVTPQWPPTITPGQSFGAQVTCEKCGNIKGEHEKCPHCAAGVPKWQVFVPYVAVVVATLIGWHLSAGFGLAISIFGGSIAMRIYKMRKKGADLAALIVASIGILINAIFVIMVLAVG